MFDLATAKTRLNITDPALDATVQVALDTVIAFAETYCNRKFPYASETQSYFYDQRFGLSLERYPVNDVLSLSNTNTANVVTKYKVSKDSGVIQFRGALSGDEFDVTYSGGYKVYPADLELAFWMMLTDLWPSINAAGGAGGSSAAAGDIESITVPDVGTIRFAKSGAASSGSSGSSASGIGQFPPSVALILNNYRRILC